MNWLTSRCAPLAACAALALASCDKGTDLNVDLPDTAAISTEYQDLPLDVATVRLAPVQTLKTDHFLVGRLADNVAGTTTARAYFNVVSGGIVADSLPAKLTNPGLDSVVLVMGFDRVYGSATTPVRFDVFQLPAPLDERQVYDGSTTTAVGAALGQNLLSSLTRTQRVITTAAVVGNDNTAGTPAVYSTVPDQSVRLLLQRTAVAATPGQPAIPGVTLSPFPAALYAALSQPSFGQPQIDALLKGLAVAPSTGHSSSIVSFGRTYNSRITVYFHGDAALKRTFSIYLGPVYSNQNLTPARDPRYYTQLENNLSGTPLSQLADLTQAVPAAALDGTAYLQEGTGLGARITFRGLDQLLATPGLTVNRAELRVPVKPFSNALFANPALLYAVEVDARNAPLQRTLNFTPQDRVVQANGSNPVGTANPAVAVLTDIATSQAYYSLPITNYLQAYLTNKLDGNPTALVLAPNIRTSSTLSLNRAAIDATHTTLRVYYSKR